MTFLSPNGLQTLSRSQRSSPCTAIIIEANICFKPLSVLWRAQPAWPSAGRGRPGALCLRHNQEDTLLLPRCAHWERPWLQASMLRAAEIREAWCPVFKITVKTLSKSGSQLSLTDKRGPMQSSFNVVFFWPPWDDLAPLHAPAVKLKGLRNSFLWSVLIITV